MTTTVECAEAARLLIDCRLDTIDRMLLGRMSRQDRLAIVREVEIQIQELLDQRGRDEITREDVLEVLSRLDPPEAFLPEGDGEERPSPRVAGVARTRPTAALGTDKPARVAGWLGIAGLVIVVVGPALAIFLNQELQSVVPYIVGGVFSVFSSMVLAALAIALGVYSRRQGAWAVVGICSGVTTAVTLLIVIPLLLLG